MAVSIVLDATVVLVPVAVWLVVRWMLLAQVIQVEGRSALGGLRRSYALVRGHWLRVASLVGASALLTLAAGPLLGATLILLSDALPLALMNVVAGVLYALAMPFVALTTTYVYFDLRAREALATEDRRALSRPRSTSPTGRRGRVACRRRKRLDRNPADSE